MPDKTPALTSLERLFKFVNGDEDTQIAAKYAALVGTAYPIGELICSNFPESTALAERVANALQRRLCENPGQVAVRTQRVGLAPGSVPILGVPAFRKMAITRGADMIGGMHSYPVPDLTDPSGFGIATDLVGVYFGPNARNLAVSATG